MTLFGTFYQYWYTKNTTGCWNITRDFYKHSEYKINLRIIQSLSSISENKEKFWISEKNIEFLISVVGLELSNNLSAGNHPDEGANFSDTGTETHGFFTINVQTPLDTIERAVVADIF